ncbi:hypothetical protein I6A84_22520, partial [Frankia sp. CNm7]|nr:hypothetical protein [Frankia nepalensis]
DVLFVGRLEEMKGPDLLVDAWAAAGPPPPPRGPPPRGASRLARIVLVTASA